MKNYKVASYLALAFGVGAVAGLLYAPKSGAETRKDIRRKYNRGVWYARRKGQELREQAEDLMEMGRKLPNQLAEVIDAGVETYKKKLSPQWLH